MKVVATKQGIYNQILREPGEVFALLMCADGSVPALEEWVPALDPRTKKVIPGEGSFVKIVDKAGNPIHRDFARDIGNKSVRSGPMGGEVFAIGWMKEVPEHIPEGFYPEGTNFWSPNLQLPQPIVRQIGNADRRAAPILTVLPNNEQAA